MLFTEKIFCHQVDDDVHRQLVRFSKGVFTDRALMELSVGGSSFSLKASYDLVKDILLILSDHISRVRVTGKVMKSKKKTDVNAELSGNELKELCREHEFVLLSVEGDGVKFKCKPSLPKPGKSLDVKFSSGTFPLAMLKLFCEEQGKKISISHTFTIMSIEVPEEFKDDPAQARAHAKRKGTLTRVVVVDGREVKKETEFTA